MGCKEGDVWVREGKVGKVQEQAKGRLGGAQ